jgi:hypothetical protein
MVWEQFTVVEAKVAAEHASHVSGWDFFLPRLPLYIAKMGAGS